MHINVNTKLSNGTIRSNNSKTLTAKDFFPAFQSLFKSCLRRVSRKIHDECLSVSKSETSRPGRNCKTTTDRAATGQLEDTPLLCRKRKNASARIACLARLGRWLLFWFEKLRGSKRVFRRQRFTTVRY